MGGLKLIGIDIGAKFIKACKIIKEKKSEYSILCAMTANPPDILSQTKKLELLLKKMRINKDSCYLAVGGKDLIYRDLFLPKNIDRKRFNNIVTLEFSQSVSEDISKMFSSFTVVNSNVENKDKVLYTVAPRQKILSKVNAVKGVSNLNLSGVTMEALALANAFEVFGPSYKNTESVLMANIGLKNTNIVVLKNKELVFMRDIDFGGDDITNDLVNSYTIPNKLAEELKKRTELWQEIGLNIKNSLKKSSANFLEAVFRTIEYCITRQFIVSVDRVVITGGGACLEGIDTFIEETLGVPTVKWNPLDDIKVTGYTNKDYGYFIPIALGLALERGE